MEVKKALDKFATSVIKQSRTQLSKKDKNASKKLYNSLDYDLKVSKNSFELSFKMEDYGKFVDKGVKGIGGVRKSGKNKGKAWVKKKVTNNDFKYKKGIKNKPSSKHFDKWTIRRGIAPRSSGGQFTTRKGIAAAISQSVWHTGLESTYFFTKPFEGAFKHLPEDLLKAFGLEVDEFLEFALK